MPDTTKTKSYNPGQIMIITGEASGDLHGANLVRSMRAVKPELSIFGMGGKELEEAGVELLYDAAKIAVVGITEVFSHLRDILSARRILIEQMKKRRPSVLILIDFPDFNLMLAKKAKKLNIPVFYYISPQVWAWRKGRTKKIGRLCDRIAVILPFEKDFYKSRGIDVDFVGHPLMDTVTATMDPNETKKALAINPVKKVIGLLPGSRRKEITSLLPDFLSAAHRLAQSTDQDCVFIIPQASTVSRKLLEENGVNEYRNRLDIRITDQDRYNVMACCDAVVAASGTVTLELAILGIPTVATYRISPRTYQLARMLVKLEWFSLVNLIGGRSILPELLQEEVTPENIAQSLLAILHEGTEREKMLTGLQEVRDKLGKPGASDRAAEIALSMIK